MYYTLIEWPCVSRIKKLSRDPSRSQWNMILSSMRRAGASSCQLLLRRSELELCGSRSVHRNMAELGCSYTPTNAKNTPGRNVKIACGRGYVAHKPQQRTTAAESGNALYVCGVREVYLVRSKRPMPAGRQGRIAGGLVCDFL